MLLIQDPGGVGMRKLCIIWSILMLIATYSAQSLSTLTKVQEGSIQLMIENQLTSEH